ncbi:enkurin [Adelges cooleyi]|uniref:enkurin n=1 Tax=Adelges cooleyi TaxID=133065 RepID=UPI00217FD582|nr:enkurin [Adelges cooleyi]
MPAECQENIKRLIPRPKTPVVKPPMYRSVYTDSIRRAFKANKDCHRTMGYAEVQLDPPTRFLKKHTRKVVRPFVEKTKVTRPKSSLEEMAEKKIAEGCEKIPRKPLPDPNENKIRKNIKQINMVDVIRKVPPLTKHRVQDTRNGHIIVLDEAGLEPTYVSKKNFGKTPVYILKMYKEKEKARIMENERIKAIKPPLRYIPEHERNKLLNGLKINWAELQKEFQLLPMITDTLPKMKKKTMLEKQLKDLEKDIDLLERSPALYVCRDADDGESVE